MRLEVGGEGESTTISRTVSLFYLCLQTAFFFNWLFLVVVLVFNPPTVSNSLITVFIEHFLQLL